MHNVNVEALKATTAKAHEEPGAVKQTVSFQGEWQTEGQPQFRAEIPVPNGEPMIFVADFPPSMGGTGSAPNPLAYCFWGGMAKRLADEQCPGVYCVRNPVELTTRLEMAS